MSWICQRVSQSIPCRHVNPSRAKKCQSCGKLRPPRRRQKHLAALDLPYEHYLEINGGEDCGICGRPPTEKRRNDRDHTHRGAGIARGLLCPRCNQMLEPRYTVEWMEAAIAYLRRAAYTP